MITRALWVTTDNFEATTPGPHFINPNCFGEDFAHWLQQRFAERGVVISDPVQEDWGWVLVATAIIRKGVAPWTTVEREPRGAPTEGRPYKLDQHNFTVSIGVMDESIGKLPATWRVGVSYEKGMNSFRKWFKAPPVDTLELLFQELQTIVNAEPQFKVTDEE